MEVLKTHKEGTEFLNQTDNVKELYGVLKLTDKLVTHNCNFVSEYNNVEMF